MNFSNFSSTFLIGEIEKSKSTFAQVLVLKSQHTNQVSPIICIHKKLKDRSEFGSPLLVVISAFRQGLETRVLEVSCCNKTQHFIFLIKKIFLLEYICVSMLYQFLLYSKVNQGGPSRWWQSKTWRSPSFTQIHQKYIYMWNSSYRTPTERWQKTSDFPKGKKLPT